MCRFFNIFKKNENNDLSQETHYEDVDKDYSKNDKVKQDLDMSKILREVSSEGIVLLENNKNTLPLKKENIVSIFSRFQDDWFYTGYGSGGDVKISYKVSLLEGLRNNNVKINNELVETYKIWRKNNPIKTGLWGLWPYSHKEMKLNDEIVNNARLKSDTAIFVIGRSSGESEDSKLKKGSYYLTNNEKRNLKIITKYYDNVIILLNIGSVIDMSWLDDFKDKIGAVLLVWQGGMESGNAISDILIGKVNPSAKLADSIVKSYKDYPTARCFGHTLYNKYREDIYVGYRYFETFCKDRVIYPFGYGKSYTNFNIDFVEYKMEESIINIKCIVKNIGKYNGKEVVQIYLNKPNGKLGNPIKILVGFEKTKELKVNENELINIKIPLDYLYSYDESGITGFKSSYVIEKGKYSFYLGNDIKNNKKIFEINYDKTIQKEELKQVSAPKNKFMRIVNINGKKKFKFCQNKKYDLGKIILQDLPKDIKLETNKKYKLQDVKDKKITLDEFISSLSLIELEAISRGDNIMNSKLGPDGNAGVLGGVLESLREKGIPPIITTDGPSGIRLNSTASLLPIETLMACTFNKEIVEKLYSKISDEMVKKHTDILLAPAINIHRNPLCGRNFEYFSEDPILSGYMASAVVKGIQKTGKVACPKHFACNNQEYNRHRNNSIISERALREIYLKGFEICIRIANPKTIMTSYNKINGVYGHYNYDLCKRILRDEWNFNGMVMTDWWMQYRKSPEFANIKNNAYRVRSRVDVLMPGGDKDKFLIDSSIIDSYNQKNGIKLGELQLVAINVLNLCLKIYK